VNRFNLRKAGDLMLKEYLDELALHQKRLDEMRASL